MKRKKLLAVGCSYTDNWWTEKHGFPVWPELLAEKLDMDCHNFGMCGAGNHYIFATMHDKINEEDFDLVVLMWSEFQRMDFQQEIPKHWKKRGTRWVSLHPQRGNTKQIYPMNLSSKRSLLKYADIHSMTQLSLRLFYMSQNLLKDIPYIMVQGPRCVATPLGLEYNHSKDFHLVVERNCAEIILKNPYTHKIDEDKFLGFPIMRQIGGGDIDSMLDKADPKRKKFRVGGDKLDTHPNKNGHEFIMERIYDVYKKNYS